MGGCIRTRALLGVLMFADFVVWGAGCGGGDGVASGGGDCFETC